MSKIVNKKHTFVYLQAFEKYPQPSKVPSKNKKINNETRETVMIKPFLSGVLLCTITCGSASGDSSSPGASLYPNLKALGFADLNYFNRADQSDDVAGQAVGHIIAEVSSKIAVFSEISAKARPADLDIDVERLSGMGERVTGIYLGIYVFQSREGIGFAR